MPNRSAHTQHIGYGVGTGIASTPHRCTILHPIIIRTTGTPMGTMAGLSAGDILAAADITAAVDMSVVDFAAVAEDTPVVAAGATGRAN